MGHQRCAAEETKIVDHRFLATGCHAGKVFHPIQEAFHDVAVLGAFLEVEDPDLPFANRLFLELDPQENGATVDSEKREFRWLADQYGAQVFTIWVRDDGVPPASDWKVFTVRSTSSRT